MKRIHFIYAFLFISIAGCKQPSKKTEQSNTIFKPSVSHIQDSLANRIAGQQIYVPIYSHLRDAEDQHDYPIASNISIRNTDTQRSITLLYVDYYNNEGKPIRNYLEKATTLKPLSSMYFVIRKKDMSGGLGANMLVEWECTEKATPPLVEAVMMNEAGTNNFTFSSRAIILKSKP